MSAVRTRRGYQRVAGVTYDAYVRMRDDRRNCHLRMAYYDGVLEITAPEFRHDRASRRVFVLIGAYCKAFDVLCEAAGSTTFRKGLPGELKGKGREADESFYIGDVVREIMDKDTLDLTVDPAPSLWVEVDNWGSSSSKLPLYAGLGVPEVWRYRPRRRRLWFGRLAGEGYEEISASRALPGLTQGIVLELLAAGALTPTIQWAKWLESTWFPGPGQELARE